MGSLGLITYMRTDSTHLSPEAVKEARNHISMHFGPEYLPEKANAYASKKNAQQAHEAIRPTDTDLTPADRRIYYLTDSVLRTFEVDDSGSPVSRWSPRPRVEDDPVVETPPCDDDRIEAFILDSEGVPAYRCRPDNEPTWYRDGEPLPSCPDEKYPRRIAVNSAILCDQSVIDPEGTTHEIRDPVDAFVHRVRPEGGFWGVVERDQEYERWRTDDDGTTTLEGVYAAPPDGWRRSNADVPGWANIDGHGAFYRWGAFDSIDDTIVRFHEDFQSAEVIYDEADDPLCKLHGSNFLTGP